MKKWKKLGLILGCSTSLLGCSDIWLLHGIYRRIAEKLQKIVVEDIISVTTDIKWADLAILDYNKWGDLNDTLLYDIYTNSNKNFLRFYAHGSIYNEYQYYGNQYVSFSVVYNISSNDIDWIKHTAKSVMDSSPDSHSVYYTGDIDNLKDILKHSSTKLYTVGKYYQLEDQDKEDLTSTVDNQNEKTDNGMEM